jgi:hypothetical protein
MEELLIVGESTEDDGVDIIVANKTCIKKEECREDDPEKDDEETRDIQKKTISGVRNSHLVSTGIEKAGDSIAIRMGSPADGHSYSGTA